MSDFPPSVREFDAERYPLVVFYYWVNQRYRTLRLRTEWRDPSGAVFDIFTRTLDQTSQPGHAFFYTVNIVPTDRIRDYPGSWTVEVFIDDELAGRYSFDLASRSAGPARPAVKAERPDWKVGERWIRSDGVFELARAEGDTLVFRLGTEREYHQTRDGAIIKALAAGETVVSYDPPFSSFQWPLEVGKTWTWEGRVVNRLIGFDGRARWAMRVVAYEDVSTPAGQFKAFKISGASGGRSFTLWYSPEARWVVKRISSLINAIDEYVLIALDRELRGPTTAAGPVPPPGLLRPQDFQPYYAGSWAVVVGIDRYSHSPIPPLTYAVADARRRRRASAPGLSPGSHQDPRGRRGDPGRHRAGDLRLAGGDGHR
jgi:hypothetical protein